MIVETETDSHTDNDRGREFDNIAVIETDRAARRQTYTPDRYARQIRRQRDSQTERHLDRETHRQRDLPFFPGALLSSYL